MFCFFFADAFDEFVDKIPQFVSNIYVSVIQFSIYTVNLIVKFQIIYYRGILTWTTLYKPAGHRGCRSRASAGTTRTGTWRSPRRDIRRTAARRPTADIRSTAAAGADPRRRIRSYIRLLRYWHRRPQPTPC